MLEADLFSLFLIASINRCVYSKCYLLTSYSFFRLRPVILTEWRIPSDSDSDSLPDSSDYVSYFLLGLRYLWILAQALRTLR